MRGIGRQRAVATLRGVTGYRATQNEDGTWTVHDVPIFPRCTRALEGFGEFDFDEGWLIDAVQNARRRHQFGYLAPLHIHHTSDPRGKVRAGFVLPKRVSTMTFSDGTLPVVFADYLQVPDAVFQEMQRGDLPYVSIETRDARKREISACALMPDGVPFAKFPLFTIGEAVPSETPPRYAEAKGCVGSAVSFASCGGFEFAALSRFNHMARKLVRKVYDPAKRDFEFTFDDGSTERGAGAAFDFEETKDDTKPAGDTKPEGEKKSTLGVKELEAALKGMTLTLAEIGDLKAILEAAAKAAGGESTEGGEKKTPPKPSNNPPEAQMSDDALKAAMEAKAETAAVRGELDTLKAEKARDNALVSARKTLDGHVIQDGELEAIFAEGGIKGLDLYVKARAKHGRKAPVPGAAPSADVEMTDLPADFEFSAEPTLRAKQVAASKAYDAASGRTKQQMTRKRFIECSTLTARELAQAK